MAENIKVGIELTSNTAEEVLKAKRLKEGYDQANESVKKLGGSMAAAKGLAQSAPTQRTATGSTDREDFRIARSGVGTGAEGRDFAKQAQGLGGLVHVYATFAANIFAVTAAFTALDKAYSVIRLEKAAEIMSNKIGFSVKNLSKDLQSATGHAISFQEAMQFSAMGISAGLTGKQITDLTVMAKGAANALGRDMGDAVRRMITGTAKQEQEILDELGIFVRAKNAYAEYAKKLGVGADELTAAQRVQAYAEAVSKAGEKWRDFAAIDDPFSRFTSTAKEAGVELLNTINAIITPLMNVLSQSKSLMEGILLVTVAKLGSMALPHLGDSLKSMFSVDPETIRKQQEGFASLVATRQRGIDELSTIKSKKQEHITQAFSTLNTGGVDFGKALVEDTLITSQVNAKNKLTSIIKDQVTTEEALSKAKISGLVTEDSTLGKLEIRKKALNAIAAEAVAITKAQNAALLEQRALNNDLLDKKHGLVALMEGGQIDQSDRKARNRQVQSEASKNIQGHLGAPDIGWLSKGSSPEDAGKWSLIMGELSNSFEKSTGIMGKAGAAFKAFGELASIAMRGLQAAMPWALALFAAWELVIKPLWDHFHATQIKIAESTKALAENSTALKQSYTAFNSFVQRPETSGEEALQAIERKVQALTAARDSLHKLIADLEAKPVGIAGSSRAVDTHAGDYLPGKVTAYTTTGQSAGGIKASEGLKLANNILETASATDKQSEAFTKLAEVRTKLLQIEQENAGKGEAALLTNEKWLETLKKEEAALSLVNIQLQIKAANLNGIIAPSKSSSKAIDDYINKSHEATTQELKDLGIKDPLLQKSYRDSATALRKLVNETDAASQKTASSTILADMTNDLRNIKNGSKDAEYQLKSLLGMLAIATDPELKKTLEGAVLGLRKNTLIQTAKEHVSGPDDAKAAEQKRWQIQAEGRALEIRGMQHALKVSDEQAAIEEKVLGFKTDKTIEMSKQHNMDIAQKTFDSQKLELERKLKEEGNSPKAKENAKLAISQAKELMQHTKMQAELKAQMEHGASTMQQYELTTGADAKRQIATIDNLQKIADLNGLLNDEDKIKNENKLLQLDLDRQIASEMKRQSTFVGATAADEKSKSDKVLADLESKKSFGNALEKAKLDKKERDDKIKDNVTYIKLYDMQIAKIHEGAVTKAKADEAEMIRAKKIAADSIKTQQEILNITFAEHDAEMRNAQIQILLIEKKKTAEAEYQQRLLDRQKTFGTDTRAQQFQTATDMVNNEAERFGKTLTPAVTTVFKAIYGGMDAAIDTLTTKWMKGEKFVVRDVVVAFRNTMAEQFRQASAEQMKMAGRQLMQAGSVALSSAFGMKPEISKQDARDAVLDTQFDAMKLIAEENLANAKKTADNTAATASALGATTQGATTGPQVTSGQAAIDYANANAPIGSNGSNPGGFGASMRDVSSTAAGMIGNSIGGGGLAGGILGKVSSSLMGSLFKTLGFANGGIMTSSGAIPLHAYANGGVASTPQMAVFGEGRMNEAYVPLPDGRSIPVSMKGPATTNPNGPISVSVQVNTTTGQTNTQAKGGGNEDSMAQFGNIIAQKVREEIIQQSRPNGLLNR